MHLVLRLHVTLLEKHITLCASHSVSEVQHSLLSAQNPFLGQFSADESNVHNGFYDNEHHRGERRLL